MSAPLIRPWLEALAEDYFHPDGIAASPFDEPAGEAALLPPDSVSWRIFKNPVALVAGGIAAVLLELAEPRVRSGVWDHTQFKTDPLGRMKRTGQAALVTVYAARSEAQKRIARVNALHAKVTGTTPEGVVYRADDPELLNWVHATASFGFLEAYCAYVRPLSEAARDRFYADAAGPARAYGAAAPPLSVAELEAYFARMRPLLTPSPIIGEFLDILARTPLLPLPLRALEGPLIGASVDLLPDWAIETLGLRRHTRPRSWRRPLVRLMGRTADRLVLRNAPAVLACRRLGLPDSFLYRPTPPKP